MDGSSPEQTLPTAITRASENPGSPLLQHSITPPPIPDHELVKQIGGGSYGEVWLARNAVGTLRAVKIVWRKTFWHDHPFEREFKGIQKFEPISRSHEGLVDILQIGKGDGYFYYLMELADDAERNPNDEIRNLKEAPNDKPSPAAQPLQASGLGIPSIFDIRNLSFYTPHTVQSEFARRGRLPVSECVRIGLSLTAALAHLHKNGLVHRDVKPSNIIFVGGVPKLADIGLVTEASEARSYVGTEGFIPPEGPGTVQADLYSLGKLLYEISTGKDRHAFPELPANLAEQSEGAQLVELNSVLLKACQPDPRARYQTAAQMHADLQLLQQGQSVRRLRIIERRVAVLTRTTLITALLLAVASAAYLLAQFQARREAKQRRVAEQLLYAADVNLAQQALEAGNLVRATTLLDAHRPLRGQEDWRGFEWYYLKNLCRGDETHTFHGHAQPVRGVAISPDGKLLASGSEDRTIQLRDLASKTNVVTLRGHADAVNALAFTRDGTRLASGSADKTVKLWDVATRRIVAQFTNHAAAVTSMAFSPDGKRLAVGTDGASAKLWDVATSLELHEFPAPDETANLVTVSPDGKWLAIAGNGSRIRLWGLETMQPEPDLYDEAGITWGLVFSPDNEVLAATRSDGIVLWDFAARRVIGKLKGHEAEVHPVAFSPDGKTLASGSIDSTVRLWDISSRQSIRIFKGHKAWVRSLAFSPDGRKLISGSMDLDVKLWEVSSKDEPDVLRGHTDSVYCVAFSPDNRILASASFDGTVKLWDVRRGTDLATLNGHTAGVTGVTYSHDGAALISVGLDKTIRFWNATTGEQLAASAGEKRLACLALSPDGRTLAFGSGWWNEVISSNEVSFWDLASRQRLTNSVSVHEMVRTLSFSPDGKALAVGMADDSLELVDVNSKRSLFLSTNLAAEVAWSPRGNALFAASNSDPDHIAVLDLATRQVSARLQVPSAAARYMAVSPDGRTLAIFYTTTKIKLCNVATGREVATLQGHEGFGMCLAFSHDGQTLATASNDRTIRLWRAPRNTATAVELKGAASR